MTETANSEFLGPLLTEFLDRVRRGEQPSIREYCLRYPEQAEQIRDVLEAAALVQDLREDSADKSGQGTAPALSCEQFCQRILQCGLLCEDELQAALSQEVPSQEVPSNQVTGDSEVGVPLASAEQVAEALIRQNKLTAYQVQQISAGRGHTLVLGNYLILSQLGEGGMGKVFQAKHRRMQRIVALKIPPRAILENPTALERFHREVQVAAQLDHPNVVTAYDADQAGDTHFLVMQYVKGIDLKALVDRGGPLPVTQALACLLQAARGLAYAHAQGIIHRDVKPANMLLDQEGTVKILDLGLARFDRLEDPSTGLTGTDQIMGTVDFMAPEQADHIKTVDARADIYSLGMTLWFLLTGRPAYYAASPLRKMMAHQQQPIPSLTEALPEVSEQLQAVFATMVAKTPDDRYPNMTAVIEALTAIIEAREASVDETPHVPLASGEDCQLRRVLRGLVPGSEVDLAKNSPVASCSTADTHSEKSNRGTDVQISADSDNPVPAAHSEAPLSRPTSRPVPPRPSWRRIWVAAAAIVLTGVLSVWGVCLLLEEPPTGSLQVTVEHPGLKLFLDGRPITMPADQRSRVLDLPVGEYPLDVEYEGFRTDITRISISPEDQIAVEVSLVGGQIHLVAGGNVSLRADLPQPQPALAPFDAAAAKRSQRAWANYLGLPVQRKVSLGQGVSLTLVLIPPGEYSRGSPDDEPHQENHDHQLATKIKRGFYLGSIEVTVEQFRAFVTLENYCTDAEKAGRSSWRSPGYARQFNFAERQPVVNVSWNDAQAFVKWLSRKEGRRFRLPTEAEWEYACRAGSQTRYWCGDDPEGLAEVGNVADGTSSTVFRRTPSIQREDGFVYLAPVGSFRPNPFGLYDTHGNVWEWCQGPYRPAEPWYRVFRGGAWNSPPQEVRSAFRNYSSSGNFYQWLGFRVACDLPDGSKPDE